MGQPSIYYNNPSLQIADPYETILLYNVVANAGFFQMVPVPANSASLYTNIAGATAPTALTQAEIDNFLGSTNEFLLADFSGATLITTSSGGIIVNMDNQCKSVVGCQAFSYDAANVLTALGDAPFIPPVTALGTTLANRVYASPIVTSNGQTTGGNIGIQFDFTTAIIAGFNLVFRILWFPA